MFKSMRFLNQGSISAALVYMATVVIPGNLAAAPVAYVYSATGQFGTMNLESGTFVSLPTPDILVSGLASSPGRSIYAIDSDIFSNLLTLDPLTGRTMLVGSTNQMLQGLEADLTGGVYAQTGHSLYSLNPATGTADLLGDFGLDFDFAQGAFNSAGLLFMIGHLPGDLTTSLYQVDPVTGSARLLGSNNLLVETVLFFNETLYGFTGTLGSPDAGPIVTINPLNGTATFLTIQDSTVSAVIGATPAFATVPEPGTWIGSLAGTSLVALFLVKRRKFNHGRLDPEATNIESVRS